MLEVDPRLFRHRRRDLRGQVLGHREPPLEPDRVLAPAPPHLLPLVVPLFLSASRLQRVDLGFDTLGQRDHLRVLLVVVVTLVDDDVLVVCLRRRRRWWRRGREGIVDPSYGTTSVLLLDLVGDLAEDAVDRGVELGAVVVVRVSVVLCRRDDCLFPGLLPLVPDMVVAVVGLL